MKLLVLGGTHGNEKLGINLVKSLKERPISKVDSLIANPMATERGIRFIEADLNRSFGRQVQSSYEVRRAQRLVRILAEYDLVLDFHNTETPGNNCCFVGEGCRDLLYSAVKQLGFSECIEATYDCVNRYCLNTVSIEISMGDRLDSVDYWRKAIEHLVTSNEITSKGSLSIYRFLQRVTWEEKIALDLSGWKPFIPIGDKDKKALQVSGEVASIFIGSRLTEFYASLVIKRGEI